MSDAAKRAELARWKWKARKAGEVLSGAFSDHGHQLAGEWCSFQESVRLTKEVEALGGSRERVIQRWLTKENLDEVSRSCDLAALRGERLVALIMDVPGVAWIEVSPDIVQSELVPSAVKWMTDGFILYAPDHASLLSVDVEEVADVSLIETTLVGEGLGTLGVHLIERGPKPLRIGNS
ncbi:hypothetical protein OOK36_27940 [Streptomyces sp. NBC_00365]|uniref:hypothetical protein n=1 Tax=Streptomyces sp. NBC_00365 TaxID=2975726 RepID=UPI0022582711|nr:hypothetical protein [Streptomyces sp. NBC_00365]MCX5092644.1 hypothetical protein [Streptomyces sp. NBC_00365]